MSSRDELEGRKLIDYANSYPDDFDDSDEDEEFYALDDGDYLLSAKWRARFRLVAQRVPRRLQRYFVYYLLGFIVFLIGWLIFVAPYLSALRKEYKDMSSTPHDRFGLNKRPEFEGLVQTKRLEAWHLPRGDAKLVVVGDVHGCKKELEQLLEKVGFQEQRDHLILTGDIIAKGPDSAGVVSLASRLGASCVRGNHEDKLLLSLAAANSATTPSHIDNPTLTLAKSLSTSEISYLQACPVILDVGPIGALEHVAVVHAGLVPDMTLAEQDPFQVMNMRTMNMATRTPSEKREGSPWTKFWNHYQKNRNADEEKWSVIYGHDKKRGFTVKDWSYGLDSGCVSGGKLTAMVIGERGEHEFVHVKCDGYVK
ncbi:Metallo-dependent phosphatase [Periconia macrospinosa]|uniref:Metallo-dependent phosphatase n=1 Tax=Periconia macrospinosa TaxID=97972 RepID=A0A2V1E635_9PLEO|nr:Metallo-dependent phosphatase [Periconia macrospinosa]